MALIATEEFGKYNWHIKYMCLYVINETILLSGGETIWNQVNYAGKQGIILMTAYVTFATINMSVVVMKMMKTMNKEKVVVM